MMGGEREDLLAQAEKERIGRDRQRPDSHLDHLRKRRVEIVLGAGMQDMKLHHKLIDHREFRIDQHCHHRGGGNQLVQQLRLLRSYLHAQVRHSRHIAARPVETCDKFYRDWIGRY
jgi:hypothetical protein